MTLPNIETHAESTLHEECSASLKDFATTVGNRNSPLYKEALERSARLIMEWFLRNQQGSYVVDLRKEIERELLACGIVNPSEEATALLNEKDEIMGHGYTKMRNELDRLKAAQSHTSDSVAERIAAHVDTSQLLTTEEVMRHIRDQG